MNPDLDPNHDNPNNLLDTIILLGQRSDRVAVPTHQKNSTENTILFCICVLNTF